MSTTEKTGRQAEPGRRVSLEEALHLAHGRWNAGRAAEAEELCLRILAVAPHQPAALHLIGLIALAKGNLGQAIGHLERACAVPGVPAVYFSNLAEMCRQAGRLEQGETAGRRAVALDPDLASAWSNLGIVLQELGRLNESAEALERALALEPDNPKTHNNLANTLKRKGNLAGAEEHWKRALTLAPDYPEALSNYSLLLVEMRQFDEAARLCRRAIELNPRFADAYVNFASLETERQRHDAALGWLDALMNIAPNHPAGLSARAKALMQADRLDEALTAAEGAVAVRPNSDETHNILGQVLQAFGRFDEAMAAFDKAVSLPGNATEKTEINRALLLREHGQTEAAAEAFDRIVATYPDSASAWFNSAEGRRFTPEDPRISRMEDLLNAPDQSETDRMALHFALGKAYFDIGDSDRAFGHLNAGNRTKRESIDYDPDKTALWLEAIAGAFSYELLERMDGAGPDSAMPIFVCGMPRSGTTLVEQILASHPQVRGAGELKFLQSAVARQGSFPDAVATASQEQIARIGHDYLARIEPLAAGRKHVVDKMPANFLHVGLIRLAMPGARIIHCRRDPVDTCLSCYTKLFQSEQNFTYDLAELGRFYRAYETLMDHWRYVLPDTHFLDVDYEAVVDDTEREIRRMLAFVGLDWDDACLNFHQTERAVRTASVTQVRKPIYRTSKGRWQQHAGNLGPLLSALGRTAS